MAMSVKYFMWPYQPHFQIMAQVGYRSLLEKLDPQLESCVFLLGFLIEPRRDRFPICVSPDDFELQPDTFENVPDIAQELGKFDMKTDGLRSHPKAHDIFLQNKQQRGWVTAIREAVDRHCDDEWNTYVSPYVELEGFRLFTIAQHSAKKAGRFYSLLKSSASGNTTSSYALERSLLEAVTHKFLTKCCEHLSAPNPGDRFSIVGDVDGIIRASGKELMDAPFLAGGSFEAPQNQFDICEKISTLLYESEEGVGSLLYIKRDHPNLEPELLLRREVPISEYGAVRKLLEISDDNVSLLSDSNVIYGLGSVSSDYDASREDVFSVRFSRRFSWQLIHDKNVLMHVSYGMPALKDAEFPKQLLLDHLERLFPGIKPAMTRRILSLAECVGEQSHGAMLVIASDAAGEANRLGLQCTPVQAFELTEHRIPMLTSIDGAILIDAECQCHAIGVILDGMAHEKCSSARGSRYNSAVRYVYNSEERLAIVKSEDGMVDVLPQLRPRIKRVDIDDHITRLRELVETDGDVSLRAYRSVMDWLDRHRFYLGKAACDEANQLWPLVEENIEKEGSIGWRYADFVPAAEMDDSYFI